MSKLAALAAKRRQKENEKRTPNLESGQTPDRDAYTASLEKLRLSSSTPKTPKSTDGISFPKVPRRTTESTPQTTTNPERKPIAGNPRLDLTPQPTEEDLDDPVPPAAVIARAEPSPFATLFTANLGSRQDMHQLPDSLFRNDNHFYSNLNISNTKTFDFTDPSPDDIVINAQKLKGSKH